MYRQSRFWVALAATAVGCNRPAPIDAGTTRSFWTDTTRLIVSTSDQDAAQFLAAAEDLDRLSAAGVDPKVVNFNRDVSAFYRRMGRMLQDAVERGRTQQGLPADNGELKSISAESQQIAQRLLEIDKYVRETYRY